MPPPQESTVARILQHSFDAQSTREIKCKTKRFCSTAVQSNQASIAQSIGANPPGTPGTHRRNILQANSHNGCEQFMTHKPGRHHLP